MCNGERIISFKYGLAKIDIKVLTDVFTLFILWTGKLCITIP